VLTAFTIGFKGCTVADTGSALTAMTRMLHSGGRGYGGGGRRERGSDYDVFFFIDICYSSLIN